MSDAVHAAADRVNNVAGGGGSWASVLKDVEVKQIKLLINQCRAASVRAIADGDLTAAQWKTMEAHQDSAESSLAAWGSTGAHQALQKADNML